MGARIHPTAIVGKEAELGEDVEVGPYSIIEGPVRIGAGTRLYARTHVMGDVVLGERCELWPGVVIGGEPQDLRFDRKIPSGVTVGEGTVIREGATIHRATKPGGRTVVGKGCMLMITSHVAHDCVVEDRVILAGCALLAGHVLVEERAFIAGGVPIHQFTRIGRLAMIGGLSGASKDVPPYHMANGRNAITGLNLVGLKRAEDISDAARKAIIAAHKVLYRSGRPFSESLDLLEQGDPCPEVRHLIAFCRATKRGLCGPARRKDIAEDRA